jgi:hypothetical protein
LSYVKQIKISRIEERPNDAWYDMSLRQLRSGKVSFYRVRDFLTGDWLFKTCRDGELGKIMVKAVKCPPGLLFSQLEGNTMLFQPSLKEGWLYDIISFSRADENNRVSRRIVDLLDEVPTAIRQNYEIKPYVEATGKTAPGKHWVTLTQVEDEKSMVALFVLERAWTLSTVTPEQKLRMLEQEEKRRSEKAITEIDTGQMVSCPICGDKFRLRHIEKETKIQHRLKKP